MAEKESRRKYCERRLKQLRDERNGWDSDWRELNHNFQPRRARFLPEDTNKGQKNKLSRILDNTAIDSCDVLASGMMAGITSPARPWFKFEVPNPELGDNAAVKAWTYECERIVMATIARSNIYPILHTMYGDLGAFATACCVIVEDDEDDVRGIQMPIGSYCLAEDHRGKIDTMYREYMRTVRQLVDEFGLEKVSTETARKYREGRDLDSKVKIVHAIERNIDADTSKDDNRNMPFRSIYYEVDHRDRDDQLLRESGFRENPILAPRWQAQAGDTYGTGPSHKALADAKALQWQQNEKARTIALINNPPMNAPSSQSNERKSLNPGAINYYDATGVAGNQGMTPVYQINMRVNELLEDIKDTRGRIRTAFFVDLFKMLTMDGRTDRTAREIQERHEEKLLMLGPVLERVQNDMLSPLLDRVFGVLMRKGKLPDPPEELQGVDLRVEYISMLAQAQKLAGISAVERFLSFIGNMAGVSPGVLDKVDFDKAVDQYAETVGVAPSLIRDSDAVAQIRQQRQQQAEQQQMAEQMNQSAEGAKLLSETDTGGNNMLAQLMGG